MIIKLFLFALFTLISCSYLTQGFEVGHTTLNLIDNLRNRTIETEVYYPSNTTGTDVSASNGNFPVIVFGHGFLMNSSSYANFWEELVPKGYIICLPTTESGANPNHEAFGKDLRFIANELQNINLNSSSLLFNVISDKVALMGHSMGGGASFLAANNNTNITTLVNFAAAETTPSAIDAAKNVIVPTLVFTGVDDCVTPPDEHQVIMFDSLNNESCATQINIIGGSHCKFANSNFNCSLGETFCGSGNITRTEQHQIMFKYLNLWLDKTLNQSTNSFNIFNDSLFSDNSITYRQSCNSSSTSILEAEETKLSLYPNPTSGVTTYNSANKNDIITVYNTLGNVIFSKKQSNSVINLTGLKKGIYFITIENLGYLRQTTLIKK